MYIPNNDLSYVIGVEKMWNDYVFIAQYIGKTVSDFKPVKRTGSINGAVHHLCKRHGNISQVQCSTDLFLINRRNLIMHLLYGNQIVCS